MSNYAIYKLKYGYFRIEQEDGVVVSLRRLPEKPTEMGTPTTLTDTAANQLTEYFDGKRKVFDFSYRLHGTEFQKKVWAELEKIPYGETRTYGQIAVSVGNPKASRAVGMANNRNPITIAVPCHRVIGIDGSLTGYAGGLPTKESILKMEEQNK